METVEAAVEVNGLVFLVRARKSAAADGWFWSAHAEDHPWAASGTRPWAGARLAAEAAVARLERLAG